MTCRSPSRGRAGAVAELVSLSLFCALSPGIAVAEVAPTEPEGEPRQAPTTQTVFDAESTREPQPSAAETPLTWHVWPLFDPFVHSHERVLSAGQQSRRLLGQASAEGGGYLAYAHSVTTRRKVFFVTAQQGIRLRLNGGSAYALDLLGLSYLAGLSLGPLELGAGVSLVPFTIEYQREWDLGGFSPGALCQASLVLGRLRLGARAFQQHSFRWTADEDARVRGVGVELGWELPQVTHRGRHPLVFIRD